MGIRIKLETKGFADYLERLVAAGQNVDEAAAEALQAGGEILLDGMKRRVPKLTGNLENNLVIDGPHQDGNQHYVEVGLDPNAENATHRYATAQEYGTSSMAAQPYVRPTIDADMPKARKAMREVFQRRLS